MAVKPTTTRTRRVTKPKAEAEVSEVPADVPVDESGNQIIDEAPPQQEGNMAIYDNIVNKAAEVYKFNPILTGMIILLILIIGALGYYMMRNDDRIYAYISYKDKQTADLYDRVITMAKECKDKPLDRGNFPLLEFPRTTTKSQATPTKGDGVQ